MYIYTYILYIIYVHITGNNLANDVCLPEDNDPTRRFPTMGVFPNPLY